MNKAHVITISDRVSAKKMADVSGPALVRILREAQLEVAAPEVVPDVEQHITDAIVALLNGSPGLSPRKM